MPLKLLGLVGVFAGNLQLEVMAVTMPRGTAYSLPVELGDYVAAESATPRITLARGKYRLSAAYGGAAEAGRSVGNGGIRARRTGRAR